MSDEDRDEARASSSQRGHSMWAAFDVETDVPVKLLCRNCGMLDREKTSECPGHEGWKDDFLRAVREAGGSCMVRGSPEKPRGWTAVLGIFGEFEIHFPFGMAATSSRSVGPAGTVMFGQAPLKVRVDYRCGAWSVERVEGTPDVVGPTAGQAFTRGPIEMWP